MCCIDPSPHSNVCDCRPFLVTRRDVTLAKSDHELATTLCCASLSISLSLSLSLFSLSLVLSPSLSLDLFLLLIDLLSLFLSPRPVLSSFSFALRLFSSFCSHHLLYALFFPSSTLCHKLFHYCVLSIKLFDHQTPLQVPKNIVYMFNNKLFTSLLSCSTTAPRKKNS